MKPWTSLDPIFAKLLTSAQDIVTFATFEYIRRGLSYVAVEPSSATLPSSAIHFHGADLMAI